MYKFLSQIYHEFFGRSAKMEEKNISLIQEQTIEKNANGLDPFLSSPEDTWMLEFEIKNIMFKIKDYLNKIHEPLYEAYLNLLAKLEREEANTRLPLEEILLEIFNLGNDEFINIALLHTTNRILRGTH